MTIDCKLASRLTRSATLIVAFLLASCNRVDPDEQIDPDPLSEPPQPELHLGTQRASSSAERY
jgi:hypothetical protein